MMKNTPDFSNFERKKVFSVLHSALGESAVEKKYNRTAMHPCEEGVGLAVAAQVFESHVRATTACIPGPCSLDVCSGNILRCSGFSSGQAATKELALVYGPGCDRLVKIEEACKEARLDEAFVIRNELVNFKKYCLRIFQRHQLVDVTLRRLSSLYFCDVVSLPSDHPDLLRYAAISGATMLCKGRMRAILDLREMGKYICQTPRHPDMDSTDFPKPLLELPNSLGVFHIIAKAELFLSGGGGTTECVDNVCTASASSLPEEGQAVFEKLVNSIVEKCSDASSHEILYIKNCLLARGCHKAIRIRHAVVVWLTFMKLMLSRAEASYSGFKEISPFQYTTSESASVDPSRLIRFAMHCSMHGCLLEGAMPVLRYAIETIEVILTAPNTRLFDAGDAGFRKVATSGGKEGTLDILQLPTKLQDILDIQQDDLKPLLLERLSLFRSSADKSVFTCFRCREIFPKLWVSCGLMNGSKYVCMLCESLCRQEGYCPWDGTMCVTSSPSEAPCCVGKSCPGTSVWCIHHRICLACDSHIEGCFQCNFVKGDGEFVLQLVQQQSLTLKHIFIDFDGTLASTKKGENPLGANKIDSHRLNKRSSKRPQRHSIDSYLREVCSSKYVNQYGDPVGVHIVTRNTHAEAIQLFMAEEGCDMSPGGVLIHVAGKRLGVSKVDIINDVMASCINADSTAAPAVPGDEPILTGCCMVQSDVSPIAAIFIDDTLDELLAFSKMEAVSTSGRILRIHFGT